AHVDLDELGFQHPEGLESHAAAAEVVDRDPESNIFQKRNARRQIFHVFECRTLCKLEDHARSTAAERAVFVEELGIVQILGIEIEKQQLVAAPAFEADSDEVTDLATELRRAAQHACRLKQAG